MERGRNMLVVKGRVRSQMAEEGGSVGEWTLVDEQANKAEGRSEQYLTLPYLTLI